MCYTQLMKYKICITCSKSKPESEYTKTKTTGRCNDCWRDWYRNYYKNKRATHLKRSREQYHRDPAKWREYALKYDKENWLKNPAYRKRKSTYSWKYHLKRRFGITVEEYDAMLQKQNRVCYVCKNTQKRRLHVDHNHKTGAIRRLLCSGCNSALGHVREDIDRLTGLINYIREFDTGV